MDFTSGLRITTPARLPLLVPELIECTVTKIWQCNWIDILHAVFWNGISYSPRIGHSIFPDGLLGSGVRRTRPSLSANLRGGWKTQVTEHYQYLCRGDTNLHNPLRRLLLYKDAIHNIYMSSIKGSSVRLMSTAPLTTNSATQ